MISSIEIGSSMEIDSSLSGTSNSDSNSIKKDGNSISDGNRRESARTGTVVWCTGAGTVAGSGSVVSGTVVSG